jgi:hypothetical protein
MLITMKILYLSSNPGNDDKVLSILQKYGEIIYLSLNKTTSERITENQNRISDSVFVNYENESTSIGYWLSSITLIQKPVLLLTKDNLELPFELTILPLSRMNYVEDSDIVYCIESFISNNFMQNHIVVMGPESLSSTVCKKLSDALRIPLVTVNQFKNRDDLGNRLTQLDCKYKGYILDGYPVSMDLENFHEINIEPDFVFRIETSDFSKPTYDELSKIWFPKTIVIRLDGNLDVDMLSYLTHWDVTNWFQGRCRFQQASYHPIEPFNTLEINSMKYLLRTGVHNHELLLLLCHDLFIKCPELQGQVQIDPIEHGDNNIDYASMKIRLGDNLNKDVIGTIKNLITKFSKTEKILYTISILTDNPNESSRAYFMVTIDKQQINEPLPFKLEDLEFPTVIIRNPQQWCYDIIVDYENGIYNKLESKLKTLTDRSFMINYYLANDCVI